MVDEVLDNTAKNTEYHREYRSANPEKVREARKRRYARNKDLDKQWRDNGLMRLRHGVFQAYGGVCIKCEESDEQLLIIRWIGEGTDPFKPVQGGGSIKRYRTLRDNKYPEGYVTLCHNCNALESKKGSVALADRKAELRREVKRVDAILDSKRAGAPRRQMGNREISNE